MRHNRTRRSPTSRNEEARSLRHRAGNAHVAISVDTRPKTVSRKRDLPVAAFHSHGDPGQLLFNEQTKDLPVTELD
jgi:hypothetical protein